MVCVIFDVNSSVFHPFYSYIHCTDGTDALVQRTLIDSRIADARADRALPLTQSKEKAMEMVDY